MNDLTFAKATADEFRTFWEGQGWTVATNGYRLCASRFTVADNTVHVWEEGELSITDPGEFESSPGSFFMVFPTTFGEALEILNELAATRAFGGWATEEGNGEGA